MSTRTETGTTTYEEVGDRTLVITRVFAAPARFVFEAWTSPEHLPNWLGPARHEMVTCDVDLRVGGGYRYVWKLASGELMGMSGTYTEIDLPRRLVATETFDDFPGESVNEIDLVEQDSITTCRVTVTYSTPEGRAGSLASPMKTGIDEGYARLDRIIHAL